LFDEAELLLLRARSLGVGYPRRGWRTAACFIAFVRFYDTT
jgi:hypothetical protein